MSRKREVNEAASPVLVLLNDDEDDNEDVKDVPKFIFIDSSEFTIGRALDSNFILMQKSISWRHCSFHFNSKLNKWTISSHIEIPQVISVQGKYLENGVPTILECGHVIFMTPFIEFGFKCSSDEHECCAGFNKKTKLSNDGIKEEPTEIFFPENEEPDSTDFYANPEPSCSKDVTLEEPSCSSMNSVDLMCENEKYKEEIRKYKENMSWQESKIKFLELKVKEKEKREIELETVKEETEMLEKQNADLKKNLATLEILELEYKNMIARFKYREEDTREKDGLQAKITAMEDELEGLKNDNAQLLSDICKTVDDLTKMTEKCTELDEKMKEKIVISVGNSTNGMNNVSTTSCTVPFQILRNLFKSTPITSEEGIVLRKLTVNHGAIHAVFACLAKYTHHESIRPSPTNNSGNQTANPGNQMMNSGNQMMNSGNQMMNSGNQVMANSVNLMMANSINLMMPSQFVAHGVGNGNILMPPGVGLFGVGPRKAKPKYTAAKSYQCWAKGTGYASGDTTPTWNVGQTLNQRQIEEEYVTILLQILSSYINPDYKLQNRPYAILEETENFNQDQESSANKPQLPTLFIELVESSCLLPVLASYLRNDSVLDMARHIPLYRAILALLRVMAFNSELVKFLLPPDDPSSSETTISIIDLLRNIETCVDTYSSTLMKNRIASSNADKDLNDFITDVRTTARIVEIMTQKLISEMNPLGGTPLPQTASTPASIEEVYLRVMKKLQFGTYDMISEESNNLGYKFMVSYHYERNARADADKNRPARMKRLAQEAATLSTSLPLSFSSSVFVRCDTDRLDVMKVLIIGPAETPYANGCFEFDVYFPPDYPNSPMLINLQTTGRHSVRFNPNLYNDGKVCLSVLNTWSGRPEEKWNPQASSFLQVLVSIQSLILVPEPYFNEPGYETSRGSTMASQSSKTYNSNIMSATVQWAMLDQIRNPSPCFKDIIHAHFWLKQNEIREQVAKWSKEVADGTSMRANLQQLSRELSNLNRPAGVGEDEGPPAILLEPDPVPEPIPSTSNNYADAGPGHLDLDSLFDMLQPSTSSGFSSTIPSNFFAAPVTPSPQQFMPMSFTTQPTTNLLQSSIYKPSLPTSNSWLGAGTKPSASPNVAQIPPFPSLNSYNWLGGNGIQSTTNLLQTSTYAPSSTSQAWLGTNQQTGNVQQPQNFTTSSTLVGWPSSTQTNTNANPAQNANFTPSSSTQGWPGNSFNFDFDHL
ncbi:uncharacterized protein LOC135835562 [Planococcus citri]|uniref:uncharacterized protein LOC135835562 n=1 Tax=Planococcus citri TaxID=170843 RepID=UPI0031F75CF1